MTAPINIEKELEDWTYDDLCKWAAWQVAQGMIGGTPLKSVMWNVISVVRQWNPQKEKK